MRTDIIIGTFLAAGDTHSYYWLIRFCVKVLGMIVVRGFFLASPVSYFLSELTAPISCFPFGYPNDLSILSIPSETNQKQRLMSRFHSIDRAAEKLNQEGKIRNDLARWDRENPELRHEMIISTLVSGLISIAATNVYLSFCRRIRGYGHSRYWNYKYIDQTFFLLRLPKCVVLPEILSFWIGQGSISRAPFWILVESARSDQANKKTVALHRQPRKCYKLNANTSTMLFSKRLGRLKIKFHFDLFQQHMTSIPFLMLMSVAPLYMLDHFRETQSRREQHRSTHTVIRYTLPKHPSR